VPLSLPFGESTSLRSFFVTSFWSPHRTPSDLTDIPPSFHGFIASIVPPSPPYTLHLQYTNRLRVASIYYPLTNPNILCSDHQVHGMVWSPLFSLHTGSSISTTSSHYFSRFRLSLLTPTCSADSLNASLLFFSTGLFLQVLGFPPFSNSHITCRAVLSPHQPFFSPFSPHSSKTHPV